MSPMQFVFRIFQGALIGLGAVLPGISGGVLGVISASTNRSWNFCPTRLRTLRAMSRR